MLFITNRFPTQSIKTRKGRNWNFDMDNNGSSNSVFFCETGAIVPSTAFRFQRGHIRFSSVSIRSISPCIGSNAVSFAIGLNSQPIACARRLADL